MPKYYCDYCDTFLTHDSPSVRKTHCGGRKHKENVRFYYQKWLEEQAQTLIDSTTATLKASSALPPPVPLVATGGVPLPQGFPGTVPPGFPPTLPPGFPPGLPPPLPPALASGLPPTLPPTLAPGLPPTLPTGLPPGFPPGALPPPPPQQRPKLPYDYNGSNSRF